MAAPYEWDGIDWDDFDDCDDEQEVYRRKLKIWHRRQTRTPQWKAYREEMFAKRGQRCEKCGRVAGALAVHHREYKHPNLNLWEYEDNEVEVLHAGRCHRKADTQREEEEYEERVRSETSPEALIYQRPLPSEARKLAQYKPLFLAWIRENYRVEPTEAQPLWFLWNLHGEEFLKTLPPPPRQMKLF
jgi:hypothetical protein